MGKLVKFVALTAVLGCFLPATVTATFCEGLNTPLQSVRDAKITSDFPVTMGLFWDFLWFFGIFWDFSNQNGTFLISQSKNNFEISQPNSDFLWFSPSKSDCLLISQSKSDFLLIFQSKNDFSANRVVGHPALPLLKISFICHFGHKNILSYKLTARGHLANVTWS